MADQHGSKAMYLMINKHKVRYCMKMMKVSVRVGMTGEMGGWCIEGLQGEEGA